MAAIRRPGEVFGHYAQALGAEDPREEIITDWFVRRTHNFAEREPITLTPTVERDLGIRRSAQRFLVVPW